MLLIYMQSIRRFITLLSGVCIDIVAIICTMSMVDIGPLCLWNEILKGTETFGDYITEIFVRLLIRIFERLFFCMQDNVKISHIPHDTVKIMGEKEKIILA